MKLTESKLRSIIREELSRLSEAVEPDFFHSVASEMDRDPDVDVKKAEYASPGPVSSSPSIRFELLDKRGTFNATFKDRTPNALISVDGPMLRDEFEVPQSTSPTDVVHRIVSIANRA